MSYYGFDMHFIDDLWCWTTFHVCVGYLNIFFKKISIQVLCPLKVGLSFWHCNGRVPYTLWIVNPYQLFGLKYYFLFHKQAFLFFVFWSFLLLCQSLLVWCKQEWGLPWWLRSKKFSYQCRKWGFNPWVRKNPLRRKWESILVVLLGKPHGPGNPMETREEPGRL